MKNISIHNNNLNLHFFRPLTQIELSNKSEDEVKEKIRKQYTKERRSEKVIYTK